MQNHSEFGSVPCFFAVSRTLLRSPKMDEQAQLAYLIQRMEDEGIEPPVVTHPPVVSSFDLAGIAAHIAAGAENIIIMAGAGISVSAGIPDFRSPGTGLYDNLQKYNLPEPEAIFEINYFKDNPKPFYMLADEVRACRADVEELECGSWHGMRGVDGCFVRSAG